MGDDINAEMWEISENLHRAELSVAERVHQTARWVELVALLDKKARDAVAEAEAKIAREDARAAEGVSSNGGTKIGRGRPESGISKAARSLGMSKSTAHLRVTLDAKLTPEAMAAAKETGAGVAVMEAAAKEKTATKQVKIIRDMVAASAKEKADRDLARALAREAKKEAAAAEKKKSGAKPRPTPAPVALTPIEPEPERMDLGSDAFAQARDDYIEAHGRAFNAVDDLAISDAQKHRLRVEALRVNVAVGLLKEAMH